MLADGLRARVVGRHRSHAARREARGFRSGLRHANVLCVCADVHRLPFDDKSCDEVRGVKGLNYNSLADPMEALAEVRRVAESPRRTRRP